MGSYLGKHAEYYDIFYRDKPYAQEAQFVAAQLEKHGDSPKNLLELACGTGSHAFELEKLGYQVLATDYSQDLLAVAQRKKHLLNSQVEFRKQDMRYLEFLDAFDAVYCLFDSIGYVQTNEAIRRVLSGVAKALRPDGIFVFEFWHAAAMVRSYEPHREREWQTDSGKIVRRSKTKLDVERQLAEVNYEIQEYDQDRLIHSLNEVQINRYFLVQEISAFLETAGFDPIDFLTAYADTKIDEDTWHILAVARWPV